MEGSTLVVSQITLGAVASWVLQALKNSSWFPLLSEESSKVAKIAWGVVASICAITGLTYVYDATAHTLLIQNFGLGLVANAVWHWLTQFVMQEGWYQVVFNKVDPTRKQTAVQAKAAADITK